MGGRRSEKVKLEATSLEEFETELELFLENHFEEVKEESGDL